MDIDVIRERMCLLREKSGLSQKELAEKINVSRSTIAGYETGKTFPSVEVIIKYADFFGTTTDYILGRIDNRNIRITKDADIKVIHKNDVNIEREVLDKIKELVDKISNKN